MSTRSFIGRYDELKGRYVHCDGYPSGNGVELIKLLQRDGYEKVMNTLTRDHYGWSSIDRDEKGPLPDYLEDGRFEKVEGYGVAYTDIVMKNGYQQATKNDWVMLAVPYDWGTEYGYLVDDLHIHVYQGDRKLGIIDWRKDDAEFDMCSLEGR